MKPRKSAQPRRGGRSSETNEKEHASKRERPGLLPASDPPPASKKDKVLHVRFPLPPFGPSVGPVRVALCVVLAELRGFRKLAMKERALKASLKTASMQVCLGVVGSRGRQGTLEGDIKEKERGVWGFRKNSKQRSAPALWGRGDDA